MRAIVRDTYGLDALELRDVDRPVVSHGDVVVRVRAAAVNPADWYAIRGPLMVRPQNGLRKPKTNRVGTDFAGTVESIGEGVTQFEPGDDVFGGRNGAFGEYLVVRADGAIAPKPANISFDEAAAVPIAGITALQGLRDKAQLRPGQTVLINGASGGVGTFSVQIAKALGGEVTAVCSSRNLDLARSLGADRIVDYTRDDFTRIGESFDVVFDVAASRSWREISRVLKPDGTFIAVGAPKSGPLRHIAQTFLAGRVLARRNVVFFVAKLNGPDLRVLAELMENGKVKPVVERRYDLGGTSDALRYLGEGHARGKIVITVPA